MGTVGQAARAVAQVALGGALAAAGVGHLTTLRREFRAQVPAWVPVDVDTVVVASGIAEIGLGTALLTTWRQPWRGRVGLLTAGFFVAIFPGNIAQYREGTDAFGPGTAGPRRADRLTGARSSHGAVAVLAARAHLDR